MKKKILGIVFILIVSIGFNVIQYTSNSNLKSTMLIYEEDLNASGKFFDKESGVIAQNTTIDDGAITDAESEAWYLKVVSSIYFHSYVNKELEGSFSAAGPVANINPYCVNLNAPNNMKVLEVGDGNFTKICLEGYVPTWYLTQDEAEAEIRLEYIDEEKYIIDETNAYYGADENSGLLKSLSKGTAIEVIGEHNEWCYINLLSDYSVYDSEMWVKKDSIGLLSASDNIANIEVSVEKGTVGISGNFQKQSPYIVDRTMIGRIWEATDEPYNETHYYVSFPGGWGLYIEKEDVRFMGE